ncbi:MAG: aminoacyl-tRNA hydrolase [Flavobacteriales bacterium]
MKYLIAGLGNIGSEYANTRHNIGFKVLDSLVEEFGIFFKSGRLADVAELKYKGRTLVLIKPSTYMNLSGKAVQYWLQQEKIEVQNMLVITDDLALPFGKIRIKTKGSHGGHNGLKNIEETLATQEYAKLRFGISAQFSKGQQVDYVLGNWNEEELKTLPERINIAKEAILSFTFIGADITMNFFNAK